MKKLLLLTKTLLAVVLLCVGQNAWGATETLSGADATTKDNAIAKTSFTMLATYNPGGSTDINGKSCLKVRWARSDASTGNTNGFALKVNAGYMITKIEAQMSGNSTDLVLSDIKVDGVSYAGEYSKTLKGSGQSPAYTNITLSGIAATDYINFEYSSGGSSSQGYVYITATYVKVNQWDFTDSGIWGSITLPTAQSNTKNYQYNGVEGTTLNYVTFYSSDGTGLRHASTLTNGIGFSAIGSTSNHYVKLSVPAGSTAIVTANCTSNRRVKGEFNNTVETFTGDYSDVTKEFANNTGGTLDLYVYCFQNADGSTKQPWLKKIVLKQTVPVTINYRDKDDLGNTLISSRVENVEVGSSYTPTYSSLVYVNDSDPYEYTYNSGGGARTVTEATSIDILYSKGARATYSYTVKTSTGSTIQSGSAYKNASVTYYWAQKLNVDGVLYEASAVSDQYKSSFVLDSDKKDVIVTYTASPTVTSLVFLAEGEDLFTKGTGSSADIRLSLGAGGYADSKTSFVNLPAGKYNMVLVNRCSGSQTAIHKFYKGEDEDPFFSVDGYGYNNQHTSGEFTLTTPTTLYMKGGSTANLVDWIYIEKTAESGTITPAGWASFSSSYPLDLSTISGGTAYYASAASDGKVTLSTTTAKVPAGEGIMVKGEPNATFTIKVADTGTAIDGNLLKGQTTTGTVAASTGGKYHYVFGYSKTDATDYGFYNLASDTEVAAGKAYLEVDGSISTPARALRISFGDITGVDNVEATSEAKAQDGKFIENGKIVIIKNGKKFNANGQQVK